MNELRQNYLVLLLQFIFTSLCSSVTAYKKSLPQNLPQTCLNMQTSLARDSTATTAFPMRSDQIHLFLLLGVRESTISGFCPFSTQTHTKAYSEVQGQNSVMSAELLNHREHTQNKFMINLGWS